MVEMRSMRIALHLCCFLPFYDPLRSAPFLLISPLLHQLVPHPSSLICAPPHSC